MLLELKRDSALLLWALRCRVARCRPLLTLALKLLLRTGAAAKNRVVQVMYEYIMGTPVPSRELHDLYEYMMQNNDKYMMRTNVNRIHYFLSLNK